jgi:hypothetical protein
MTLTRIFGLMMILYFSISGAYAGYRFQSKYYCYDSGKTCVSSGERVIDGIKETRDCWEWEYTKTCAYPSLNNCSQYSECYFVKNLECLLKDSAGYCVNQKKELSCERWYPVVIEQETARMGFTEKDGKDGVLCEGIPCIDGNCVDKSYLTNGEMMDSVSKLYAVSKMNPNGKDVNAVKLFQGNNLHCSKKPTEYSSCCDIKDKGWGTHIGAKCTPDENRLRSLRFKNLCVYVGKTESGSLAPVKKHHYCCFNNMLDKVIQVGGRKQLGKGFGTASSPDCRGLTIAEIQAINWEKVDFREFIEDLRVKFAGKYKAPNPEAIGKKIQNSTDNIREYNKDARDVDNNMSGWRKGFDD